MKIIKNRRSGVAHLTDSDSKTLCGLWHYKHDRAAVVSLDNNFNCSRCLAVVDDPADYGFSFSLFIREEKEVFKKSPGFFTSSGKWFEH